MKRKKSTKNHKIIFLVIQIINKIGNLVLKQILSVDHYISKSDSLLRNKNKIKLQNKRLSIYTTYKNLYEDESERILFSTLRNMHFDVIQVVNGKTSNNDKQLVKRKNLGYDLAACRDILNCLTELPEELFLINSSTEWDNLCFLNLQKTRELSIAEKKTIIFATQSKQPEEHGQSFFIYGRNQGVKDIIEAYSKHKNWFFKRTAIKYGEIPLMKSFNKEDVGFLFEYETLLKLAKEYNLQNVTWYTKERIERGIPVNPSADFWELLQLLGAGFKKRRYSEINRWFYILIRVMRID